MTCEIKNTVTRPNGPYGDVMLQGYCATHDFRVFEGSIHGKLCPIGQIEAATAKALARIAGTVQVPAGTTGIGSGQLMTANTEGLYSHDTRSTDNLAPVSTPATPTPKRPRKPKPTEE